MTERMSEATWKNGLKDGAGTVRLGSGAFEGTYSFASRFENGSGTNPEELIAAAHAGCYAMALSHELEEAGFRPEQVSARATVRIEKEGDGFAIPSIHLHTTARVPGIDESTFQSKAEGAASGCPVSKALASTKITLSAELES